MLLDTKADNPNHYLVLAIFKSLQQHPRILRVDLVDYATAVRRAQALRYDCLLALDGEAINIDVLSRLKPLVGTSVLWAWEDPYERARTTALAGLFDLIFTNDPASVSFYAGSASFLPLAACEYIPVQATDKAYDFDLSFVGTAWPNRVLFLRRLMRAMPTLRTNIALTYNSQLPRAYLDLPESSYVRNLSHPDFLDVASRSRINLTLPRDFSGDGLNTRALGPGPRLFEIALAGGFQLVDTLDMTLEPYVAGVEMEVFTTFEECLTKIRRALASPKRRIEMARAAQIRTKGSHTFDHRIDAILDRVEGRRPSRVSADLMPQSLTARKRPRLLFVTHNTISNGNFGGVEVYQETLADLIRSEYEVMYYRPATPAVYDGERRYVVTDARHAIVQTISVPDFDIWNTLSQPAAERAFSLILGEHAIDLVHFHHLISHCASLPIIANILGVPSVYTLQDFWLVCTRFNLIDHNGRYCAIADRPKTACDVCLNGLAGLPPGLQDYRRSFISGVLAAFDRIIGNSPSSIAVCRGVYPELPEEKFVRLGLPIPFKVPRVASVRPPWVFGARPPLSVVFLGNFTQVKGALAFIEAARMLRSDDIVFTICGRIDADCETLLQAAACPNVILHGGFAPGELALESFDVSLHLSIWPETYCITLSEAWAAGVVPVVSSCGALGDRVKDGHNGYHVPLHGSGELVAILRRLAGNRRELAQTRSHITADLWLTPEKHWQALSTIYADLIAEHPQQRRPAGFKVETGAPSTLASLSGRRLSPGNWTQLLELDIADPEIISIPMTSLRQQLASVRLALSKSLYDNKLLLDHHLDAISGLPALNEIADMPLIWKSMQPPLQAVGWLQYINPEPTTPMLAVRSLTGDLILREMHLHERLDLRSLARQRTLERGFITDPIAPEMLDGGIYALEVITIANGTIDIAALAAIFVSHEGVRHVRLPRYPVVKVPLPSTEVAVSPSRHAANLRSAVDAIAIAQVSVSARDPRATAILALRGWMVGEGIHVGAAPACLVFLGESSFKVFLEPASRIDVSQALYLRGSDDMHGYNEAIALAGLPPGLYTLEVRKTLADRIGVQVVGRVRVAADGKASLNHLLAVENA